MPSLADKFIDRCRKQIQLINTRPMSLRKPPVIQSDVQIFHSRSDDIYSHSQTATHRRSGTPRNSVILPSIALPAAHNREPATPPTRAVSLGLGCQLEVLERSANERLLKISERQVKPRLEHYRYLDLLLKNKRLLRRGAFDLAIKDQEYYDSVPFPHKRTHREIISSGRISLNNDSSFHQSCGGPSFYLMKKSSLRFTPAVKVTPSIATTINEARKNYTEQLETADRSRKSLANCMNRLLGYEAITQRISPQPRHTGRRRMATCL